MVKARPGSGQESVVQTGPDEYAVSVTEPPVQGRANAAIIRVLAEHLGTSPARVRIVSGRTSRNKIIEVQGGRV